jgi:class 3 adenylate cyclase/tetratricopeptide (TPR) repeat protein
MPSETAPVRFDPLALMPYVPGLVARRFTAQPEPPVRAERDRSPAAVLFADISGFTALAEQLASGGPAGVEELTNRLNACFGQMVSLVAGQGGDVVKFAGDALLAVWPITGSELAEAAARAARCGLMMQEKLQAPDIAPGGELSMRIGVGAGDVVTAHLGGVSGRWELLVAGPAISQVIHAEPLAAPGDVILSPEAFALLREQCEGESRPPEETAPQRGFCLKALHTPLAERGARPPPAVEATAAALKGYVPPAVLARLEAGQSEWLSELRRVSACFIGMSGLDDTDGPGLDRAHAAVRAVQELVNQHEGALNKLSVDDKGPTLLVAFGLPPLAHEDDPARAVQAAVATQEALRAAGFACSIGVATGRAFCGVVGTESRREYTMIGDVVNRAARLMQLARDDVLCDAPTRQAAEARIGFEALPAVKVKGRVEPIEVSRPRGGALAERRTYEMVGRATERSLLAERLRAVGAGRGGVVLIEGEAGIGKSRLVLDLLGQAEAHGVRAIVGSADAVESATPYLAWRAIVEKVLELPAAPELRPAHVLERLRARPDLERLAPLLNEVLPLGLPGSEVTEQMEGQVRADNTRALLVGLLDLAASRGPMVVVLEDAHWLDSSSWALAWRVCQRVPDLLLVLVTRPLGELAPTEHGRLQGAPGAQSLRLGALPSDDSLALVRQRLGVGSVPSSVADLIGARAGGNPFFTEELISALRDAGAIVVENGECRIAPGADLDALSLPETVEGVVMSRIDRLAPSPQLALKVGSVVGHVFGYWIVRDIHPIPSDIPELPEHLATLQQRDLTAVEAPEPDPSWSFRHAITRDVAYNLMLFAQRRDLHRAAGEWYERTHRDELARFYPLLAHHWGRAEVVPKAIEYQALSGEQALSTGAYREAALFLAEALSLDKAARAARPGPKDRLRRARCERQLGEAHLGLGNTAEGRIHLMAALEVLGAPAPASRPRIAAGMAHQVPVQVLSRLLPRRFVGKGKERAEELLEAARAYIRLVEVYWFANDTPSLVHAGLRALNLAERAGPSAELARAYAIMCLSAGSIPIHGLARAYARRATQTARAVNQLWPIGYTRFITSVYAIGTGEWEEIREALDEAAEILERLGDRRLLGDTRTVQAMSGLYRGDFGFAGGMFRDVHAAGVRNENVQHQVWGLIGMAECRLRGGRSEQAAESLEEALALLEQNPDRAEQLRAHGLLAVARLRGGNRGGARESAAAAAILIRQFFSPTAHYLLEGYAGVAEVWLSLWGSGDGSAEVRRAARTACAALRKFARVFPIGKPRALLWTGLYEWQSGRPARARADWEKSLAAAQRLDMLFEQALAHSELGRHAVDSDREAARHLARARELLIEVGATPSDSPTM